jgi:hypothetical protein
VSPLYGRRGSCVIERRRMGHGGGAPGFASALHAITLSYRVLRVKDWLWGRPRGAGQQCLVAASRLESRLRARLPAPQQHSRNQRASLRSPWQTTKSDGLPHRLKPENLRGNEGERLAWTEYKRVARGVAFA